MDILNLLKQIWEGVKVALSIAFAVIVVMALLSTTVGGDSGLQATLTLLVSGVLAGALVSSVYEKFKWFQGFDSDAKLKAISVTVVGLPIAAKFALDFIPLLYWEALEGYWVVIVAAALAWLGSQAWHAIVNRRSANGEP